MNIMFVTVDMMRRMSITDRAVLIFRAFLNRGESWGESWGERGRAGEIWGEDRWTGELWGERERIVP